MNSKPKPRWKLQWEKKYSKKRAIFKNKSEKRDLQLIKVFSLKRSTESKYDDPVTAKGSIWESIILNNKSNKQDMVGDQSTPLNLYGCQVNCRMADLRIAPLFF